MADKLPLGTPGRIAEIPETDTLLAGSIQRTIAGDLTFEDPVTGVKTLAQLAAGGGTITGSSGVVDRRLTIGSGTSGSVIQPSLAITVSASEVLEGAAGLQFSSQATNLGTTQANTVWRSSVDARLRHGSVVLANATDLAPLQSTGVYTGGIVTINANPALFDVSAGTGVVVDDTTFPPTVTPVSWAAAIGVTITGLATQQTTFLAINSAGSIVQQSGGFSLVQQRTQFTLCRLAHPNFASIENVITNAQPSYAMGMEAQGFFDIFGAVNLGGNAWSHNGASLQLTKTAGTSWSFGANYATSRTLPSVTTDAAAGPATWKYIYRNPASPTGFSATADMTLVTPNTWDDGTGVLATVPNNNWTVQWIYLVPDGLSPTYRIHYGQAVYTTQAAARAGITSDPFAVTASLSDAVLCTRLIVKQGATALNGADAQFISAGKFGSQFTSGGGGTGDQTITLTGDVTGSGVGSFAATIASNAVTYAKMQDVTAASRLIGRGSAAGAGDPQEITLGSNLAMSGTAMSAVGLSGTNTGDQTITLTGDVTGSGTGSFAATIANDSVTFAKMQNVLADRLLGRGNGGGTGDTQEITLGTNLSMSAGVLNAASGATSYTTISPASIGANQNNYSPTSFSTADILRLTGSGNFDITGFDAAATTVRKLLWNVDAVDTFTIKHESASSTAANRVTCPYDLDMKLAPDNAIVLHYDATTARWRAVSFDRKPPMLLSQARRTVGALVSGVSFIGWDSEVYPTLAEYLTFDSAGTWTVQKSCTLLIRATLSWQAATSGTGSLVLDIRKNAVTVLQEQRSSAEQLTDNHTTQTIEVAHDFVATDTIRLYATNFGGSPTTTANMMIMSIMHVRG